MMPFNCSYRNKNVGVTACGRGGGPTPLPEDAINSHPVLYHAGVVSVQNAMEPRDMTS
jgi:hypothetical protein